VSYCKCNDAREDGHVTVLGLPSNCPGDCRIGQQPRILWLLFPLGAGPFFGGTWDPLWWNFWLHQRYTDVTPALHRRYTDVTQTSQTWTLKYQSSSKWTLKYQNWLKKAPNISDKSIFKNNSKLSLICWFILDQKLPTRAHFYLPP
jgi:hypothetical protein